MHFLASFVPAGQPESLSYVMTTWWTSNKASFNWLDSDIKTVCWLAFASELLTQHNQKQKYDIKSLGTITGMLQYKIDAVPTVKWIQKQIFLKNLAGYNNVGPSADTLARRGPTSNVLSRWGTRELEAPFTLINDFKCIWKRSVFSFTTVPV